MQRLDLDGLLRGIEGVVELFVNGSQVQLAVKLFGLPSAHLRQGWFESKRMEFTWRC